MAISLIVFLLGLLPVGCAAKNQAEEDRQLEYTVMDMEKIPEELAEIIEENKMDEIKMTWQDGRDLYLIRGYGEQQSGGYQVLVMNCVETEEKILFETRLTGPAVNEKVSHSPSWPVLTVKIASSDKEVCFNEK